MLEYILTQMFNGFAFGMILILIAMGLTIIFGMLGVINFAHGEFLLIGAYIAWTVYRITGSFLAAICFAISSAALVGLGLEKFLLSRIYKKDNVLQLLLTFAFAEVLREMVIIIWGREGLYFPLPDWAKGSVQMGFLIYPKFRLIVMGFSAIMIGLIFLLLNFTNVGLIIRAATSDKEMVDIMGINISRIFTLVFVIGVALAGFSGALLASLRSVYPALGVELIMIAFVVIVVGGLGSLKGTIVSGIIIGEIVTFTSVIYSPASEIIVFIFLAIILVVRPRGFWGEVGLHTTK